MGRYGLCFGGYPRGFAERLNVRPDSLTTPLSKIKGVGPKAAGAFREAGLETVEDLVSFLPREHTDFSKITPISELKPGKVTVLAKVEDIAMRNVRRGLRIITATLVDGTGKLKAVWFNQPYRLTQLGGEKGEYYFSGEFEFSYNRYQLTNPSAERAGEVTVQTGRILPIYPEVKGLKNTTVRRALSEIRPLLSLVPETLPASVIRQEKLLSRAEAINGMHFPDSLRTLERSRERLAFEELFQLLLASNLNKEANSKLESWRIPFDQNVIKTFVDRLPFRLTDAQRRAAWQILKDFEKPTPMNRLLQGDVGSGKTVVAGIAALQAASVGFQTAIMAPTEILAFQHADTLRTLLSPFDVNVAVLTGSIKGAARQALYQQISTGKANVIVGTHALIQDKVNFHRLGFVVIDEQHRFGVTQRQALQAKAEKMPHLLSMTATPIPRSLALTVYGELDLSVLNELPKGRQQIKTKIWSPNSRAQLYGLIDAELAAGRQAYVICGLIDDNVMNEQKSVEAEYRRLRSSVFSHRRIGLLHGRLSPAAKTKVMKDFAAGELDILVSTTVVEVGVDVPNATVILIEDADKFGLSQLHQLRGRVGRSSLTSYCYLVPSSSAKPSRRLRELERSTDGFYLAEVDLKLRGPGQMYGTAQHGAFSLQFADLGDSKLIARASGAAKRFLASGESMLQYKKLYEAVRRYQRLTTLN